MRIVDEIAKKYQEQQKALKNEIDSVQYQIFNEKLRVSSIVSKKESLSKELEKAKDAYSQAKDKMAAIIDETIRAQKQADLSEEGRRAIRSYLMAVFEDALASIGDRASGILSRLPNMQTATIYFEPFKEVASGPNKGKVKEEVTAILSVDGEEAVPIRSISGGERASVDLAVDLAVVDLIEEKSGIGTNYLILDEPCSGMDIVGKEQYVEILKTSGSNKKILIVDHSSEVKEMVEDTILVIREGLQSRIA